MPVETVPVEPVIPTVVVLLGNGNGAVSEDVIGTSSVPVRGPEGKLGENGGEEVSVGTVYEPLVDGVIVTPGAVPVGTRLVGGNVVGLSSSVPVLAPEVVLPLKGGLVVVMLGNGAVVGTVYEGKVPEDGLKVGLVVTVEVAVSVTVESKSDSVPVRAPEVLEGVSVGAAVVLLGAKVKLEEMTPELMVEKPPELPPPELLVALGG